MPREKLHAFLKQFLYVFSVEILKEFPKKLLEKDHRGYVGIHIAYSTKFPGESFVRIHGGTSAMTYSRNFWSTSR